MDEVARRARVKTVAARGVAAVPSKPVSARHDRSRTGHVVHNLIRVGEARGLGFDGVI